MQPILRLALACSRLTGMVRWSHVNVGKAAPTRMFEHHYPAAVGGWYWQTLDRVGWPGLHRVVQEMSCSQQVGVGESVHKTEVGAL